MGVLDIIATAASVLYYRRAGHVHPLLRYTLVVIGLAVLGVAGFGILLLFDEVPVLAWLMASLVVVPLLVVGLYLARTTEYPRIAILTGTVMAWGGPFLLGIVVVLGVMEGIESVLDLAPVESRQMGVPWIAATAGGVTTIISMLPLANRLGSILESAAAVP
ncbi:MAG: hypothetical protein V5A18_04270 [Haloarculaceae archaeon]